MYRNYLARIIGKMGQEGGKESQSRIYPTDVFLASYPKSGNTWMRFILAKLMAPEIEVNFHNAVTLIPEWGVHHYQIEKLPFPRLLKTHNKFHSSLPKAVYIIRDPRDVYISYFHYLRRRIPEGTTFGEFLRNKDHAFYRTRWMDHVLSWSKHGNKIDVRYEDLLVNTHSEIERVLDFLDGFPFHREYLDEAIASSSFERMREIERRYGRPFLSKEAEKTATTFVRKGQAGDWENYYSDSDLHFLYEREGEVMRKYGYIQ